MKLLGFFLIIATFPLGILIAVCLVLINGLPILFRQKRVGKDGKIFTMYKFRTMRLGAVREQKNLKEINESVGPTFKIRDDPRFTSIGKFLSHTGLDELPQLWNVLRGEMALIGPRPLPVAEEKKLKSWMKKRHSVLPGIISPAILTGSYHSNFDAWMKSDVSYALKKNIISDIKLFFQAVALLFRLFARELRYALRY